MNINYKIAFIVTLVLLGLTWILFACYLVFTLIAFSDAGKSGLITSHDCTDGEYCANDPENMPDGGWTNNTTPPMPPIDENTDGFTPAGKVDAGMLYQNEKYGFRFNLNNGETAIPCEWNSEGNTRLIVYIASGSGFDADKACEYSGSNQYIFVTSDEDTTAIESLKKMTESSTYKTQETNIFNVPGTRYKEVITAEKEKGEHEPFDFTMVYSNGKVYEITSNFYNRNVYIW